MSMKQSMADAICRDRVVSKRRGMWRGGYAKGGRVAPDLQDDDLEVMQHLNTSGEPHTEGLDEITHPMEFMSDGGEVLEDDDEYMPGATTRDVAAEPMPDMGSKFHSALKRRPRRLSGGY